MNKNRKSSKITLFKNLLYLNISSRQKQRNTHFLSISKFHTEINLKTKDHICYCLLYVLFDAEKATMLATIISNAKKHNKH